MKLFDPNHNDFDLWMYSVGEVSGWKALSIRLKLAISKEYRTKLVDMQSMTGSLRRAYVNPSLGLRVIPSSRIISLAGFSLVAILIFMAIWMGSTRPAESATSGFQVPQTLSIKNVKGVKIIQKSATQPTLATHHCD